MYAPLALYKQGGKPGLSGGDWVRRQRIQLDSLYTPSGGHGFTEWYATYHKTHPEYFGLQSDGTRVYKGEPRHAKLCQSNPAVVEHLIIAPTNGWEWAMTAWPARFAYPLLGLLAYS